MRIEPGFDLEKLIDVPELIENQVKSKETPERFVTGLELEEKGPELEQTRYNKAVTRELSQYEENYIYNFNFVSYIAAAGAARVQVNLENDPVFHGRTKVLRLTNYLLALPKNLKHKPPLNLGQLCETGETE